jgi:putative DNA methylase
MTSSRLIETEGFPFEFVSRLAERESWRKEIHRPIYHVHKWWAQRLGSVFRAILLGSLLGEHSDLASEFYNTHNLAGVTVFDPFMGSGTTIGEAHKLGFTAIGRDINPVAVQAVRTALGPMDRDALLVAFERLSATVGETIRATYRSKDSRGRSCDVLYFFWVMQVACPSCDARVDLFPSWVIARNAYPGRKPAVQVLCASCGEVFPALYGQASVTCRACGTTFNPHKGVVRGPRAGCSHCGKTFKVLDSVRALGSRPGFRLYGKLVLTVDGHKEYLRASGEDQQAYQRCVEQLQTRERAGEILLPAGILEDGHNTRQAIGYNFLAWRDFFNDRQLLCLSLLHDAILHVEDERARLPLLTLFSGVLEFNNLFASYKGEGTGAVRHMFSHHILKPERTPIEANVWGTTKSSGSFSNLFRNRLMRASGYRVAPTEVGLSQRTNGRVCSAPFSGRVHTRWPSDGRFAHRAIYLSCGDSATCGLPACSVDLVVTDPPFFDNVHYSELADFFYAWQRLAADGENARGTTRSSAEVQDSDPGSFALKLKGVFQECRRVLKDDGLLVFSYHHSRDEGWKAVAEAVLGSGFIVTNAQPVRAEMSVATPKAQAKEPIQLDIVVVCRKADVCEGRALPVQTAENVAREQIDRLHKAGFSLSRNDQKIVLFGQLLRTLAAPGECDRFAQAEATFQEASHARSAPQQAFQFD